MRRAVSLRQLSFLYKSSGERWLKSKVFPESRGPTAWATLISAIRQMCLFAPTQGWPGWVYLGNWLHTQTVTRSSIQPAPDVEQLRLTQTAATIKRVEQQ